MLEHSGSTLGGVRTLTSTITTHKELNRRRILRIVVTGLFLAVGYQSPAISQTCPVETYRDGSFGSPGMGVLRHSNLTFSDMASSPPPPLTTIMCQAPTLTYISSARVRINLSGGGMGPTGAFTATFRGATSTSMTGSGTTWGWARSLNLNFYCNRSPASPTAPTVACQWECGACGTYRLDKASDGLPVELMEFSIEPHD